MPESVQNWRSKQQSLTSDIMHYMIIPLVVINRKTSSSRDTRKMYGDVTPGDTTHQDVTVSYQNHFQTAYRSLQKIYNPQTKEEKFKVWEKASDIVQVI